MQVQSISYIINILDIFFILSDGCLLHMTAVAYGCLSQYLRVILHQYYVSKNFKQNQWKLNGVNPVNSKNRPTIQPLVKPLQYGTNKNHLSEVVKSREYENAQSSVHEDEQYIVEDPDFADQHPRALPPKQTSRVEVRLAHQGGGAVQDDDQQPEEYVYYDEEEEERIRQAQSKSKRVKGYSSHENMAHSQGSMKGHGVLPPGLGDLDSVYAAGYCFVLVAIGLLLYMMCRFVRHRRVVIRYHYR